MKEKSIVIVMDEDKFHEQKHLFYNSRKTLIHVYDGDVIIKMEEQQKEIEKLKSMINEGIGFGDLYNADDEVNPQCR